MRTDNLDKMAEMLQNDPGLQEKIITETGRLAQSGEAAGPGEALIGAVRAVLDIDLTEEEVKALAEEPRELSPEDMEAVSGGGVLERGAFFVAKTLVPLRSAMKSLAEALWGIPGSGSKKQASQNGRR